MYLELAVLLQRTFLLTRWEGFLEFAIDEKVPQDTAWTPRYAIGPAFYTRRMLFVNEDISTADQVLSLAVVRSTWYVVEMTRQAGFEEDEGIDCRGDMADVGRVQGVGRRGVHLKELRFDSGDDVVGEVRFGFAQTSGELLKYKLVKA